MAVGITWQKNDNILWTGSLAYVIGLITSDGYLAKETNRIEIVSKDLEIIAHFKNALAITNKIGRKARGGEVEKKYLYVACKDKDFYAFLLTLGLTPTKSKIIQSVKIPDQFYADFLRGVFDGDGTFWTQWDTRWPNSFVFHIAFYSASKPFIEWLHQRLHLLYGTNGHMKKGAGVYEIRFAKGDSKKLFEMMYHKKDILFLARKYHKIQETLDLNEKIKQNVKHAVVAQW